ncbi:sulfate permease [Fragilariopsis cylindrus CCMP1102]|uniref:Sulfate permease n=1 Tax=Fragilariopsis cylindrus CCMP1102 TaxID=635003 RepID=A0A1E7EQD1_9STRA|nr:sulfate permease [Fragilariopsis cylindrus CCMP1102]|eukprot:OEU08064.1 sulfate permease [Fragilariopsis cylindrus CCMP1102]
MAGITVGIMLIPQAMSYAALANLQPGYGLYAGFVPPLIYALMGTSRQLAVGPVAIVSLLTASALKGQLTETACPGIELAEGVIPEECGFEYLKLAILLSFMVGIIQLCAGLLRLGFLISFVGHPVVSGFTSGSALTIALTQIKYIVGYDIPKGHIHKTVYNLFKDIGNLKYVPFLLGIFCTGSLLGFKQGLVRYPNNKFFKFMQPLGALLVCIIGIGIMYAAPILNTEQFNVTTVGTVNISLKSIYSGSSLEFQDASKLMGNAFTIALIGFMESFSIAKTIAVQHGYGIIPNQELVALGTANLAGSLFSAYPTTGSFSRSAVNNSTGAQTLLSGMVTSIVMLLAIGVLSPALQNLPEFCLAAIVISSVVGLFAYKDAIMMWKVKKSDFLLWIVAFLFTIFFGAKYGLGVAIVLSLLIVIYESVTPQIHVLWSIPNTCHYRHVRQPEKGNFIRGVHIFRIATSSMYFANSNTISVRLEKLMSQVIMEGDISGDVETMVTDNGDHPHSIVLDMTTVETIDTSALKALEGMYKMWFHHRGVQICFANCSTRVLRTMDFARFNKDIVSEEWFFPEVQSAVNSSHDDDDDGSSIPIGILENSYQQSRTKIEIRRQSHPIDGNNNIDATTMRRRSEYSARTA